MRVALFRQLMFLLAGTILSSCSEAPGQDPQGRKKPLLDPRRVSTRFADVDCLRFLSGPGSFYLLFREFKPGDVYLSIVAIDPKTKGLQAARKALRPDGADLARWIMTGGFAVLATDTKGAGAVESPDVLIAYAETTAPPYVSIFAHYWFAHLRLERKTESFRADKVGEYLPHTIDANARGGLLRPADISLVRRAGKKPELFLVGSNHTQTWWISSDDGGKTWSKPRTITRDHDHAKVVETSGGELLLFCSAQTDASGGRRAAINLRRSQDGAAWSEPRQIVEAHELRYTSPFIDGKVIWLAYADERKDGTTIYLTRSADDGKTWEKVVPLTEPMQGAREPAIAVRGDTLFLAFVRPVPRRPGARKDDVRDEVWYGDVPLSEIKFSEGK